jgi:Fe-S cluster assembly iron-binding protein IscA
VGIEVNSQDWGRARAAALAAGGEAALRVRLRKAGCAGRQLELAAGAPDAREPGWVVAGTAGETKIYAPEADLPLLEGAALRWESSFGGGRWTLDSPKAKSACGCGLSIEFDELPPALKEAAGAKDASAPAPRMAGGAR